MTVLKTLQESSKFGVFFFFFSYGIAAISPFSHRLSFDHLPGEIQRLRCKVNFQALRFVPHITSLGDALVSRLRNPLWRSDKERKSVDHLGDMTNPNSRHEPGKFAVLHLRFDKVMFTLSFRQFQFGIGTGISIIGFSF